MHYNSFKSRYLRVMLLSLVFLLTAGQLNAKVVYFKNIIPYNSPWEQPYVHYFGGQDQTTWPGKAMTHVEGDWWKCDIGNNNGVIFNNGDNGQQTHDLTVNNDTETAFICSHWDGEKLRGNWTTYTEPTPDERTYYLKHGGWGNNDWGWKQLTSNGDGTYSVVAIYNGTGCNWNTSASDSGSKWVASPTLVGSPANGDECTFTLNPSAGTVTITKNAPVSISEVYIFGGLDIDVWNDGNEKGNKMTDAGDGVFTYEFTYNAAGNKYWAFKAKNSKGAYKFLRNDETTAIELGGTVAYAEYDGRDNISYYCDGIENGGKYLITLDTNNKTVTIKRVGGHTANEIPVYPHGVQSETELAAYDFAGNNVVYLLATVLNNNRVSPEWQMTLGTDGKYHLDGFAMRNTWCRDWDGSENIPGGVKVRVYSAIDSYTDKDEKEFWNAGGALGELPQNPLTEGRLFNAEYDPATETLTLTEDESAQGRMPFISLVGNAMKQDQPYLTPRGLDGKPAGQITDYGWQEAWIQYDENGNILKDRNGNVMYSTMWPPRNPIYFTANIGGERLYSSEQMTFKPQTEEGTYVSKTGAQWMAELKTAEHPEYDYLSLDENATYYRYIVPDIWYVGSAKIWTGWAGQTTGAGADHHPIAQWSNHRNWGYGKNMDTGTSISPENTYGVSTADGSNGNFMFDDPTYFKTIEFFYSTEDPNSGSKIYTTLAFGKAQIEAQSHKDGDKYDHGMYKPTVSPDEGVSVLSYIIRCYEAATGKIVALNNGIVAHGEGNPSNANFLNDREGLAEGKYYYEMEVVFQTANGTRTATVRSNPFIIHFPGVYTLEPVAQQLAQMGTNPNGYVSYSTSNEAIYHVTLNAAGEIESIAPVAEGERAELYKNNFGKNEGINWSDKVLVVAPVPAQFKLDAEKAEPAVSLETISTYDVTDNGTHKTVAKRNDGSLAYVANSTNFDSKAFNAVMNYQDITTSADKTTEGKAVTVEMMRPNPKAEAANVTVEKVANTDNITVDGKAVATDYYKVCVNLNFGNANVTANSDQPAFMVYNGTSSKLYTAEAGKSYFTLSYAAVDPNEFSAANIEVAAFYKDKNGNYTLPANIGDPVVANEQVKGFEKKAETEISKFELANVVDKDEANHLYVTKLATATTGNDNINGTDLDVDQYRMRFDVDDQPVAMATYFNSEALNFEIENVNCFNPQDAIELNYSSAAKKATVYIAPMYPVLVNGTMTVNNLVAVTSSAAGAPALKAEPMYIALYGYEARNEIEATEGGTGGIVTGINDITSKDVQSVRFVNVAGQMSDKPFEGMNIMVTTYTDGTITTAKVIK